MTQNPTLRSASSPADTASEPLLELRSVSKRFGATEVLKGISLQVAQGEFLVVLGQSGSGKTTILRLVAGFERPDGGEIWMAGERLDRLPPYRRRVNTVFQHYALFPHLSVFENVAYGLRVQRVPRAEIPARVEQALALVKMREFARRRPAQLSGGQQQRVALARALINRPQLLLLDEPLSALDANLRREMQTELKSLQREVGISFIFVTHDQDEAMALSDRIALLRAGELEQVSTPREIYSRPLTTYTAQFIGQTNLLRGEVRGGIARCGGLAWRYQDPAGAEGPAIFSLRPENIRLTTRRPEDDVRCAASGDANSHARTSAAQSRSGETVRFRAGIGHQRFGGATDLLKVVCSDGLELLVRMTGGGIVDGQQEFEFRAADALRVEESRNG